MKKRLTAIVVAALMLLPLSACNKSGSASSSGSTATAGTATTTLTWTEWDGGDTLKVYQQVAEDFMKANPDIKLKVVNIPEEYDTKLTAMITSNQQPDIAMMESSTLLYPLAEEGKLVNLLDLINKDSSFDSSVLLPQLKYMKDSSFMAGYAMGAEVMTMFYNPTLFSKAGVSEPPASYADAWDWDTFVKNAKLLTLDKNGKNATEAGFDSKHISQYGVNISEWWPYWGSLLASDGCDYLNSDGSKIALTDSAAVDALQKMVDLIYVDHVSPTPTSAQSLPGLSETITTGKVAMTISGQWSNFDLMNDGVNYNVAALPKIGSTAKTMITCGAFSIFQTKNVDASWKFFKFMYSKDTDNTLSLEKSGLWLPTLANMYGSDKLSQWIDDKHPSNYTKAIADPMISGTAIAPYTSYVVNFSKINDIIAPALDSAWAGEKSVKAALSAVIDKANAQVDGRRDK